MSIDINKISENLIAIFKSNDSVLIAIKGSPDPDVLASSLFLKEFAALYDCDCKIYSPVRASLPQNQMMISRLSIKLDEKLPDLSHYSGYAICDFQTPDYEGISENLTCLIHIDHHAPAESAITPSFQYINQDVNAVSTILSGLFLLHYEKFEEKIAEVLGTALSYGILSDTDNLVIATKEDKNMYENISKFCNKKIINQLTEMPYSEETLTMISKALIASIYYKDWLLAGIGYVPAKMRDSLAITADFLLEKEEVTTVVVFAIVENETSMNIDASFRTIDTNLDLNRLIKRITPNGGGRKYKGAYQLDVSYFRLSEDKQRLWETVKEATMENIKRGRDRIRLDEMKNFFDDLKHHFSDFFTDK
jgi:nanoRNase/pAp phosphatase (c-di-AMP/oligoRNAs hydrolase)